MSIYELKREEEKDDEELKNAHEAALYRREAQLLHRSSLERRPVEGRKCENYILLILLIAKELMNRIKYAFRISI